MGEHRDHVEPQIRRREEEAAKLNGGKGFRDPASTLSLRVSCELHRAVADARDADPSIARDAMFGHVISTLANLIDEGAAIFSCQHHRDAIRAEMFMRIALELTGATVTVAVSPGADTPSPAAKPH